MFLFVIATQPQVGFAWIQYKVNKDFTSSSEAQNTMDEGPTPAVIGPGPALYIVDDHHTLCALDYSGYEDTSVTLNVLCDKRNLSAAQFWSEMDSQNLAYLASHPYNLPNSLPQPISYTKIPTSFDFTSSSQSFTDDPWRSMAGFSRKVQDAASPAPSCSGSDSQYCERCMFRGCVDGYQTSGAGVYYFEFRWAYYMNDATYINTQYWPSTSQLNAFKNLYEALPVSVVGKVNTDDWFEAANNVISLCRSSSGSKYVLPSNIYTTDTALPGYYDGYVKLNDDPSCSAPVCK